MKKIILATLLTEWAEDLTQAINELDVNYPAERQFDTHYRRKPTIGIFDNVTFGTTVAPEKRPDLYDEVKTPLPHPELDPLRTIRAKIADLADALKADPEPPQPERLTQFGNFPSRS
jgi:hypothetical protein